MSPTMGRSNRTQTWGGRLAELELEAEQAATVETPEWYDYNLFNLGEVVQVPIRQELPTIVVLHTFGGRSIDPVSRTRQSSGLLLHTFGARSIYSGGLLTTDLRELKNRRRVFLIDKKFQVGLSQAEEAELEELQAEHGEYLDTIQPPPFDKLEELEAFARNLNPNPKPPLP